MPKPSAGMKLRCKDGHWEWADFEFKSPAEGTGASGATGPTGYQMMVHCDYGEHKGHWLAPDPSNGERVIVIGEPYGWPLATEAFAARDRYARQVQRELD